MQIGLMGMALSLIMVLFVPTDGGGWFIWLFVSIPQFFNPAIHDLNKAMLADVVDYDQLLWYLVTLLKDYYGLICFFPIK